MEFELRRRNEEPFNINDIKKCLLSRKLPNKLLAAKRVYRFLIQYHSEEIGLRLINADLIEMLCEASCTTDISLLKFVFKCLNIFIEFSPFFQQNRTAFALESIIRALYILMKTNKENRTLILGLQLVCDIICRVNKRNVPLNTICDVPNILHLVRQLFKSTNNKKLCVYIGSEVVISLVHSHGIIKFKKLVEDSVSEVLKLLTNIANATKDKSSIIIMSEVVNASMRFLVQPKVEIAIDASKPAIFVQLSAVMKEILTPYIIEYQDILINDKNTNAIKIILSALLSIYYCPEDPLTEEFSHYLVSKRILSILSEFERRSKEPQLVIVIRSLLFELLQCISSAVLGKDNWKGLLLPGLEGFPLGGSYGSLFFDDSSENAPIASIVFNYFSLMASPKPSVDLEFQNNLGHYILSLNGIPSPTVTKAIWFTFAVGYLCNKDNSHYSKMALIKLINFILHYNMDEVYTHHPAVLYWAFSDESLSQELQARIIKYWLDENDNETINQLRELLTINRESCFVIMGLMVSESKLSDLIYKLLSSVLVKTKNNFDYIFEHAWTILPQYLVQSSSFKDSSYYEGLTNIMKLCYEANIETLDLSLVLRISCLLPGAFTKYFSSITPSDKNEKLTLDNYRYAVLERTYLFVNNLVQISLGLNDKRVSAVFLKHEEFLNAIEMMSTLDGDEVFTSLLRLLSSFIQSQKYNLQKSCKIISIDVTKLIQFLCAKTELCVATVRFLALYLELMMDKDVLPLVNIPLPTAIQLRTLYFQIHMVCAKSQGEISTYCWRCLKRLLELSESIGLKEHLSSLPYTSALLLKSSETEAWREAVSFLSVWIKNLPHYSPRAFTVPDSVNTLIKLKDKLSETVDNPNIIAALSEVIQFSKKQNMIPKKAN